VFAKDAPAEQRAAAREDLEVLACILTCAFKLARRLHNAGALVDHDVDEEDYDEY
jgi:hypothetical protein